MTRRRPPPRKPSKSGIKAAADRAEKRAKGEDIDEPKVPITPEIVPASKAGRPTAYRPEYCQVAAEMALNGSTDEEIAHEIGVDVRTLYRWRGQHEVFRQSLQWGKDCCDERVERSLYARSVGYTYDAVKIFQHNGEPVIVPHKEHVAPDVGAIKMWLTNRKRRDWSDTVRNEVSGVDGGPIEVSAVSKLDVARWIAQMLTAGAAIEGVAEKPDDGSKPGILK
jgi:hypothetical protein